MGLCDKHVSDVVALCGATTGGFASLASCPSRFKGSNDSSIDPGRSEQVSGTIQNINLVNINKSIL